jgi:hypothetical protein
MTALPLEKQVADIRAKCIEANPEIVELKYGCEVRGNDKHRGTVAGRMVWIGGTGLVVIDNCAALERQGLKIIGRPIRLSDVLLAINEYSEFTDLNFVTQAGAFGKYLNLGGARGHKIEATAYLWNLRRDDLTQQTPETISSIHSLLCV